MKSPRLGSLSLFLPFVCMALTLLPLKSSEAALSLLELGSILAQTIIGQAAPSEVLLYVHTDHLGTPVMMTDEQGQTVWEVDMEPFGETTITAQPGTTLNLRFPGQYFDAETGLQYNHFRDYDRNLGRYLTPDPLLSLLGPKGVTYDLNPYPYVGSNPLIWIDPRGLWTKAAHEALTRSAMKRAGFNMSDLSVASRANIEVDRLSNQLNNPAHYMPGTGWIADKIIERQLSEAVEKERTGDRRGAMEALGAGLHTIQDKWAHEMQNAGWKEHIRSLPRFVGPDPDNPSKHPREYADALRESEDYVRRFLARSGIRAWCPR